eukprot:TRINITY_DN8316_c0_g1_i1.p1 TRINITY_DN8316_c0_g1~~TRINITY_DN8316_c0_g1_i1.p1  ORF type:complete len:247 (+),score=38.34 TRINITY_DN8316_c0_g1_i1:792-1532(+)
MSRGEAIRFIKAELQNPQNHCNGQVEADFLQSSDPASIVANLCDKALKQGSKDNMTAILVLIRDGSSYHSSTDEYLPGPYEDGPGHREFQEAYTGDARKNNHTLEEARKKVKLAKEGRDSRNDKSECVCFPGNAWDRRGLGLSLEVNEDGRDSDINKSAANPLSRSLEILSGGDVPVNPLSRSLEIISDASGSGISDISPSRILGESSRSENPVNPLSRSLEILSDSQRSDTPSRKRRAFYEEDLI